LHRPIEPAPTRWALPEAADAGDGEVAGVGADLEPGTLLAAYRRGLFPMRLSRGGPLGWWAPLSRGVIPLDGLNVSRSLRRSMRRFSVTVDTGFTDVMRACGDRRRPDGWIDDSFIEAYTRLHELGWAHSIEVWSDGGADGGAEGDTQGGAEGDARRLVGGLYGVAVGGLFAGESMFHTATDASKVALVTVVERLRAGGGTLFDVQWRTPHLASLGAIELTREEYGRRLADALARPQLRL
jgi:leucyl/phenylalanyl-tRNA---protein transferase